MDREEWITSQEAFELGFSTTQTRKKEAMQAVEADFVYNLVMKNKELQNTIKQNAKELAEKMVKENTEDSSIKESVEITKNLERNSIKRDAWASFFNTIK